MEDPDPTDLAAMTAHRFFFGVTTLITLLAYRNLFHDHLSLVVTLVGIVFSVVLVVPLWLKILFINVLLGEAADRSLLAGLRR